MSLPKLAVEFGPVQETLLIPLLGRAEETRRRARLLCDPKSIEIVASLDCDFGKRRRPGAPCASSRRLFRARLIADSTSRALVESQQRHDAMRLAPEFLARRANGCRINRFRLVGRSQEPVGQGGCPEPACPVAIAAGPLLSITTQAA